MRRALVVAGIVLGLVALGAAPAMAQARDPFEPLIQPGGQVSNVDPDAPVTGEAPPVIQPSEQMPNTGANTVDWTAGAYILMVLGGALLVLGQLYRRPAHTRAGR